MKGPMGTRTQGGVTGSKAQRVQSCERHKGYERHMRHISYKGHMMQRHKGWEWCTGHKGCDWCKGTKARKGMKAQRY